MSSRCHTCKDILAKDPFGLLEPPFDPCTECADGPPPNSAGSFSSENVQRKRPDKPYYYLGIALAVAQRSTCLRSAYGAIVVIHDRIVSTGYNGSRRGAENCCDRGECFRAHSKSRSDYHLCPAVHAEANSIMNSQIGLVGGAVYIAGFDVPTGKEKVGEKSYPCVNCYRLMVQAGIKEIFIKGKDDGLGGGPIEYWDFLEK